MAKTSTYTNINGVMPKSAKIPFTHNGQNYNMHPGYEADLRDFNGYDATGNNDITATLQAALNEAVAAGVATILVPAIKATYKIGGALQTSVNGVNPNCQIYTPLVQSSQNMVTVRIKGMTRTNFATEGVENAARNQWGVIFESTITGSGTNPSVFGTPWYYAGVTRDRNYMQMEFENLIVRTKSMSGSTHVPGTMTAINGQKFLKLDTPSVKVDITSNLTDSEQPINETYGIIYPDYNCQVPNGGNYVHAEGYKYGVMFSEHAIFGRLVTVGCDTGATFDLGSHQAQIQHFHCELNRTNIHMRNTLPVHITLYDTEHYYENAGLGLPAKWYAHQKDLTANNTGYAPLTITRARIPISGTASADTFNTDTNAAGAYKILFGDGANCGL